MDLLKCPRCGEEYSPSYRRCPFCEEGDHPRKVKHNSGKHNSGKQNGGRRVSDKKQTHSARGAMAAVLVVVLLLLSWSLFGEKIVGGRLGLLVIGVGTRREVALLRRLVAGKERRGSRTRPAILLSFVELGDNLRR